MLALSATSFSDDKVFEKEFLERNKFKCIDSKISGVINWKTDTEYASLEEFFHKARGYAKLIYNTDPKFSCEQVTETDCENLATLRHMKE